MKSSNRFLVRAVSVMALSASASGCIPYPVSTTAQPVPQGHPMVTGSVYPLPPIDLDATRGGERLLVGDAEVRFGASPRSDVGVRLVGGFSGVVVNYKWMLTDTSGLRLAVMPGIGIVNVGNHGYAEFTLIASGPEHVGQFRGTEFVPYGGLRSMHVWPLSSGAVRDKRTLGGFVGVRIGSRDFGVSPEVGVFHDPSALGVRDEDIVVVPSINLHGAELLNLIATVLRVIGAIGGGGRR